MHSFTFNGHSSEEFGIRIERFPDLNRSSRKFKSESVSGRNGNIYQMQDAWEEVTVSYQIFAGERQDGAAVSDFTAIMEWLNSADDYAELTDSYDPTHYRLAVFVDEMEIESEWHTFGKATIRFRCRPERFIVTSPLTPNRGGSITNPTNHVAEPVVTLTGSGQTSLINLEKDLYNGTFSGTMFSQAALDILPECLFMININPNSYSIQPFGQIISVTAKTNSTGTLTFDGYWWQMGIGMLVPVRPNTDYTLSYGNRTAFATTLKIALISDRGVIQKVSSFAVPRAVGQPKTFHTQDDTAYVIVVFGIADNNATKDFYNIMLAYGSRWQTFKAYNADPITSKFRIADTQIVISSRGFGNAVIDCERETFSINGVNADYETTVTDMDGNLSDEYLKIPKDGSYYVDYTSDIQSVSIDPKYWEL